MKKGTRRLDALASDGVERATVNGPPTAFRIWRAGENTTDHGETRFTERSAVLLMKEQALRSNRYSMDVNHLSLDKTVPLENQKAVGFFSLDVRAGELWAVDCEWTDVVRAGLTKDPPEWKYFSPAYDVDAETGEVVSFLNCALTNTPATWGVTALASRAAKKVLAMKWSDIKAALEGDDEDAKASAYATIAAAFPDKGDDEGDGEKKKDSADDAPDSKKDEPKKDSADDAPDSKKDAAKASVVASQDAALATALSRIAALEKKDESTERAAVMAGREMTKILADSLRTLPLSTVKSICAGLPVKAKKDLAADAKVTATRGDTQGGSAAQSASAKEEMDVRMGLKAPARSVKHDGRVSTFDVMTKADARRHLDAKKGGAK